MSFYVDKQYETKQGTPLTFHNITRFVLTPIGIFVTLNDVISARSVMGQGSALILVYILDFISVGLSLAFFIGSFNWKKYAFTAKIISIIYSVCVNIFGYLVSGNSTAYIFGEIVASVFIAYLTYVYYKKREKLFNDSKYDEVKSTTINDFDSQYVNQSSTNDYFEYPSSDALYCKKCGSKLDPDSVFCKKCGAKVDE